MYAFALQASALFLLKYLPFLKSFEATVKTSYTCRKDKTLDRIHNTSFSM
jgi:hypothetical protein